jgi:hypothetical protein
MTSRYRYLAVVMTLSGIFLSFHSVANEDAESKAAEAAITWLALIDEEQYDESWDAAAYYFRNAIAKEQREQSLNAVRKPLGKVVSREIASRTYTKAYRELRMASMSSFNLQQHSKTNNPASRRLRPCWIMMLNGEFPDISSSNHT